MRRHLPYLVIIALLFGVVIAPYATAQPSNGTWALVEDSETRKVFEKVVEPTATNTPDPTATDVPPTATEVPPTATSEPTPTDVPPTATQAPGGVASLHENYIPLGVFERGIYFNQTVAADLAAHNLDSYLANNADTGIVQEKLNVADAAGINMYWRNTDEARACADLYPDEAAVQSCIDTMIAAMTPGSHPSLRGHIYEDEPFNTEAPEVHALHQAYRNADPSNPVFSFLLGNRVADNFNAATDDVLMVNIYSHRAANPVCVLEVPHGTEDLDIATYMRMVASLTDDDSAFWPLLQAHNFDSANNDDADLRQPTVEELRMAAWIAVGEGATGLFWFKLDTTAGMAGLEESPALYAEVADIASRVRSIDDLLLGAHKVSDEFVSSGGYASSLQSRDGATDYVTVVNRGCADASLTVSSGTIVGDLEDVETGEVFGQGQAIPFRGGDGRIFRVVPDGTAPTPTPESTATSTPEPTATNTPEPTSTPTEAPTATPTEPPTTGGVPEVIITDFEQPVDQWWASHPLNPSAPGGIAIGGIEPPPGADEVILMDGMSIQTAITNAPPEGRVIYLSGGTYANDIDIVDRDHIHIVGLNANVVILGGTVTQESANNQSSQISACAGMKDLNTFHTSLVQGLQGNASQQWAVECFNDPVEDIYFSNVTFDGNGTNTLFMSRGVKGVVYDNVTFTGFVEVSAKLVSNLHHNIRAENVWFRGCTFSGGSDHAVNFDGVQGGGVIESTVTGGYDRGAFGVFTNNDFTEDLNQDGQLTDDELRIGRYAVFENNQIHDGLVWAFHMGGQHMLIRGNDFTNTAREFVLGETRVIDTTPNTWDGQPYHHVGMIVEGNTVATISQEAFEFVGGGYEGDHLIRNNSFGDFAAWIVNDDPFEEPIVACSNTEGGVPVDAAC